MFTVDYVYVIILTILVNIPFGFLRGPQRQFSILWFVYIHLPVPLVIWFRNIFDVDLSWGFAPFYFGAYLLGQWLGKKTYFKWKKSRVVTEESENR
jgi:hypothetical protein